MSVAWRGRILPAALASILASSGDGLNRRPPETPRLSTIRLPHAILMALTGAALGGSGATYQGLFRNPLADPYLIGVASGAGLGAVLAITFAASLTPIGLYTVPAAAFLGALLTVLVVYALARTGRAVPTTTLILAGVAVGSFATSLTSFLLLSTQGEVRRALAWLLGGYTLTGWAPVWVVLPYLSVGLAALLTFGHPLNVLQFGASRPKLGLLRSALPLVILAAR
jgi:iron complex transport system permease protein